MLWTVSIAWGFSVLVSWRVNSSLEMEMPVRTFLNWYHHADYGTYTFNTRPVVHQPCQCPFIYYLSACCYDRARRTTVTMYGRHCDKWRNSERLTYSLLMDDNDK
ncbi:hypothetical protein ZIOFF_040915 [Zingiber officinale]|uniref:Secreted protein n=1 Tax=Zingiber officinale TaxID=94328 RepID=A0A8J5GD73_ZINOF|nr:hypothetical protein ZIOFF_040915 [Zingiber officinale]